MSAQHTCPRCHLTVAEDRLHTSPFICDHCGYSQTANEINREKSDSWMMIALAGGVVAAFVLMASSVELRYLQARDLVGLSSLKSLERMTKVCTDLANFKCVEKSYARQAALDPRRTAQYANYLIIRRKFKEAAGALTAQIKGGKADSETYVTLASALAEAGQLDQAVKYFELASAQPKAKIEHVQTYVKYLSQAKRFDQALAVILRARRTQTNALPVEYRVISAMRSSLTDRVLAGKK